MTIDLIKIFTEDTIYITKNNFLKYHWYINHFKSWQ